MNFSSKKLKNIYLLNFNKLLCCQANEDIVFAPGQAIEFSLKQLAERRTDIFGVGTESYVSVNFLPTVIQ